eukprot:3420540-Alexandrium_andersonii.AAC.1
MTTAAFRRRWSRMSCGCRHPSRQRLAEQLAPQPCRDGRLAAPRCCHAWPLCRHRRPQQLL